MTNNLEMRSASRRRFRLMDAIIMIAAMAVGLAGIRCYLPEEFLLSRDHLDRPWYGWTTIISISISCLPIPAALGVGIGICRLIPPRPCRQELASQPGFAACVANSFSVLILTTLLSLIYLTELGVHQTHGPSLPSIIKLLAAFLPGTFVVWVWLILVYGRKWRPEPSWIDRAGRLIGFFWILLCLSIMSLFL